MSVGELLLPRVGRWVGDNRLWLAPNEPEKTSPSTMTVSGAARDHVVRIDYDWVYEGRSQEGTLIVGFDRATRKVTAAFADSWHMSEGLMLCEGTLDRDAGTVSARGSYGDGQGGPDWGWRVVVEAAEPGKLGLVMYNITPDGDEQLAVRAQYAPG